MDSQRRATILATLGLDADLTPDEVDAFNDTSSPRTTAIVLGAIVEDRLTSVLRLLMRDNRVVWGELFHPSGPLGAFATKIRIAHMFRIVDADAYGDLIVISKIRNRFAHNLSIKTFDEQSIADLVKKMTSYQALKSGVKASARKHSTLRSAMLTVEGAYKMCLTFVIHTLVGFEKEVKAKGAYVMPFVQVETIDQL